jgi:hypothetical protein
MKLLIVFVFSVLVFSVANIYQAKTSASVYEHGFKAMMDKNVNRGPAIGNNKE